MGLIRILFLSDTHLGFDAPSKPRVARRRRGPDFFSNFDRALEPARRGDVDVVVHGGDVLYRSRVGPSLVERAFRPLKEIASRGIPVYVVPGNHERSRIPHGLLARHDNLFLFDRPRAYVQQLDGFRLGVAGFPYSRNVRAEFRSLLDETGFRDIAADATLLLMHHAVEGARVGPGNFTFRDGPDVVRASDIPGELAAVLSGHLHRAQALTTGFAAPVLYPGSIERTSFAEKNEKKGYLVIALEATGRDRGKVRGWKFHQLPARPMFRLTLDDPELRGDRLTAWLENELRTLPPDAVVQIRIDGEVPPELSARSLRSLAPPTMNLSLSVRARSGVPRRPSSRSARF